IAQQSADPIIALEDRYTVTGSPELLSSCETRRTRADDTDLLSRLHGRRCGNDPARLPRVGDDREVDGLDGYRVVVDPEDARSLAGRRTEGPGELREVVGGMKPPDRLVPLVAIDEIVPVGNQVAERTALMTEGDPAIHAARALLAKRLRRPGPHDLLPVLDPLCHRPVELLVPL